MEEINMLNPLVKPWLDVILKEQWTLAYDGEHRYGKMTTNLAESFNNVVKGIRALSIKVIVESSFKKTVKYFNDHRQEANHGIYHFISKICYKFVKNELKGRSHVC
jgi:hypothetical protein